MTLSKTNTYSVVGSSDCNDIFWGIIVIVTNSYKIRERSNVINGLLFKRALAVFEQFAQSMLWILKTISS